MELSLSCPEALLDGPRSVVGLRAPGRLHLGFLDPSASLGRRFGSLGLVINGFETEVELGAAPSDEVCGVGPAESAEVERAAACLQVLKRHSGRHEPLRLKLVKVLPAHAGFGSGTQLALAVGRAFAHWHSLEVGTPELAHWLGRGRRSGIGIAGFDQGGLLVDGGPGADGTPAPVLARIALPAAWRVLVVQDSAQRGLSGADERHAIATMAPLPRAQAAEICHQVLMRVLPGAAGAEFAPFAAGINRIQQLLGGHFAPVQGGTAFSSAAVARMLGWIGDAAQGAGMSADPPSDPGAAVGQSSWGPTGFAILPSQARADALLQAARAAGVVAPSLTVAIVSGRNTGATLADTRRAPRAT